MPNTSTPKKTVKRGGFGACFGVSLLFGMDLRRINGATVHSLNLAKALRYAGVDAQIVSFDSLKAPQALWLLKAPFAAREKTVFIRSGLPLVPVLLSRLLGKKVFLNVAALKQFECDALARPLVKISEDLAIRLSNGGVATISPHLAAYCRSRGASRVFVYPLCVDLEKFARAKPAKGKTEEKAKEKGRKEKKFVLGYVGSGDEWQGLDLLADALKKVGSEKSSEKIELRAYGSVSEERKKFFAGDPRAKFFKPVPNEEIPSLLKSFDLFVIPRPHHATAEYATPIKLVEAFAAGCAVLATDVGGVAWLARDGENALVCEASSGALAEKIIFALENLGKLASLRKNAAATAKKSDYRVVGEKLALFLEGKNGA